MYRYLASSHNKVSIDRKAHPEPLPQTEDKAKLVSRDWREMMSEDHDGEGDDITKETIPTVDKRSKPHPYYNQSPLDGAGETPLVILPMLVG